MSALSHKAAFAAPEASDGKKNLIGLDREELAKICQDMGEKPFRVKQLWHAMYIRGDQDFNDITTLPKSVREEFSKHYTLARPDVKVDLKSTDGTRKFLLSMADHKEIEAVHIPESDRGTLCVSSQVGCTLSCKFCHTGTQKLVRNLSASEILLQFLHVRDVLDEWSAPDNTRMLSTIVMMGMGEPLYNYENVSKALKIIMDPEGIAFSRRRITLSTAGVVPMIEQCGRDLGVNLAISLHATNDELRDHIVPLNKKYPIKDLIAACHNYPRTHNARRITFEYVMLKDVNDSDAEAKELCRLIAGIPAKINLIPFNPWPGSDFERSTPERIESFARILNKAGYASPIRTPRGEDILAACGQLKSASMRLSKSKLQKVQEQA